MKDIWEGFPTTKYSPNKTATVQPRIPDKYFNSTRQGDWHSSRHPLGILLWYRGRRGKGPTHVSKKGWTTLVSIFTLTSNVNGPLNLELKFDLSRGRCVAWCPCESASARLVRDVPFRKPTEPLHASQKVSNEKDVKTSRDTKFRWGPC